MKSGELNSAECYEQSACQVAENQKLADKLDAMDLIVFQISNALRAARIRVQREDRKMSPGWIDLDNTEKRLKDLLADVRFIGNDIKKQVVADYKVDPTEYVRNS